MGPEVHTSGLFISLLERLYPPQGLIITHILLIIYNLAERPPKSPGGGLKDYISTYIYYEFII
jgi:hypothetical protein